MSNPISRFQRAAVLFLLAVSCMWGKMRVAVGPNADFASYKTYQWLPVKVLGSSGIVENDPRVSPAIREAVNRELQARGLTEVPEGGDLQVAAFAMTASIPQLEAVIFPGGVPLDFATPVATMGRYNREGTLAVNLIESRTNTSAWAGLITKSIDNKPGSGLGKIPGATRELFRKYPSKK